ncbi:unannotated protein [freshwater metagenome]|uniref:Unannotated protein n=1 Tax=freshwater metagenome TaxID=449393 RepID=A0A6J7C765_9ZZZZ
MLSSLTIPSTLDTLHPGDVVKWAAEQFGAQNLVVTASFQDATLVHVAATAVPGIEIVLLDTQYLFAETQWFADQLTERYDLNLRIVRPLPDVQPDNQWQTDVDGCCNRRKVEPLSRAIDGKRAWISGVRRADSPTRANSAVAAYDLGRGLVKVNPLVMMTDADVELYAQLHELPTHPLVDKGYASIGCWPCTRPVAPGEDARSGRWAGDTKTECGLHL